MRSFATTLTLAILLPVWIAAGSMTATAQETAPTEGERLVIRPGDGTVDGRRITPYEVVWVQYYSTESEPGRTLRRTVTDQVELVSAAEQGDALVRTQVFLGLDGVPTSERVNRADLRTLSPLTEDRESGGRSTHIDYDGAHVSGAMIPEEPGDRAIVFDERVSEPGFDFDLVPLVLASIDLSVGLEFEFPHVRIAPPGYPNPEIVRALFRVEGREQVDAGTLGRVEAWRIVEPEHEMTFWIFESAPYLVRLQWPYQDRLYVLELGTVTLPDSTE